MRKTLTLFIAVLLALPSFADDRSEQEMQTIALQALCSSNVHDSGSKKAVAKIAVEKISVVRYDQRLWNQGKRCRFH